MATYLLHSKTLIVQFIAWFALSIQFASAQYTLNGSAVRNNCHCYTLTPDDFTSSGSVWNNNKIDLTQSFTFTFNVFLGCTDENGADGIAFVLQPISTSIGSTGEGLGFQNITPAVGVTLDTWQNSSNTDPAYDHLAVQINGDLNHNTANNLAGPVPISAVSDNVEDCKWHILKISWDAAAKKYAVYFDGALRLSVVKDFVKDVFTGDPRVYWGFTGATGGAKNLQQICTTLDPSFHLLPGQKTCIGEPVTLYDSSMSFGPIMKRYWDFGDGSPIDSISIDPVHTYSVAKDYTVSLAVTGADGCIEVSTRTIKIGSKPVAAFKADNGCEGSLGLFVDSSYVAVGTINNWYWNLAGSTSIQQNPTMAYNGAGIKTISLAVSTLEGCTSDTTYKITAVNPKPVVSTNYSDACVNTVVNFTGTNNGVNIAQWKWDFGDGVKGTGNNTQHKYSKPGSYPVMLFAIAVNGCTSDTVKNIIEIYGTHANAGNDTTGVIMQPVQLKATGGLSYQWTPATGLNNPNIDNPTATLNHDQTYILKAFTPLGCETFDTITVKIFKGPEIYVPAAFSPNKDGLNDEFKAIPIGITKFNFLKIYNRWGQDVFSTSDYKKGWNGEYKNIVQPTDVYLWMTSGIDFNGKSIVRKGIVTLVK